MSPSSVYLSVLSGAKRRLDKAQQSASFNEICKVSVIFSLHLFAWAASSSVITNLRLTIFCVVLSGGSRVTRAKPRDLHFSDVVSYWCYCNLCPDDAIFDVVSYLNTCYSPSPSHFYCDKFPFVEGRGKKKEFINFGLG